MDPWSGAGSTSTCSSETGVEATDGTTPVATGAHAFPSAYQTWAPWHGHSLPLWSSALILDLVVLLILQGPRHPPSISSFSLLLYDRHPSSRLLVLCDLVLLYLPSRFFFLLVARYFYLEHFRDSCLSFQITKINHQHHRHLPVLLLLLHASFPSLQRILLVLVLGQIDYTISPCVVALRLTILFETSSSHPLDRLTTLPQKFYDCSVHSLLKFQRTGTPPSFGHIAQRDTRTRRDCTIREAYYYDESNTPFN